MLLRCGSRIPVFLCASSVLARSSVAFSTGHRPEGRAWSKPFSSSSSFTTAASAHGMKGQLLVSVEDAVRAHGSADVAFVDGSWFLPPGRNGREEFEKGPRIANARFFDIDDISTPGGLPHMMPPKRLFEAAMDAMGISNDHHIVVYGSENCMFIHRAWFQIRNMGHPRDSISLMQGSLTDWKNAGGPIEEEGTQPSHPVIRASDLDTASDDIAYKASDAINVVTLQDVKEIIAKGDQSDAVIVDVRSPDRFFGRVEEPRPGMRLGHMPGAKNIFFKDLLDPSNVSRMKSKEQLEQVISDGGVDLDSDVRIIASCGSGATACALVVALEVCGKSADDIYLYDGSWSEWGSVDDTPIVK